MVVSIQIDKREPLEEIEPMMKKILAATGFPITVTYKSMKYGDYFIKNGKLTLKIERKEIGDYVDSYGKGELKEKLWHMRQEADRTALLIEGHYISKKGNGQMFLDRGGGIEPVMLLKTYVRYLTSQQEKKTWMYYTNNLFETLLTVVYLADYLPTMQAPNPSIKCGNVEEWLVQLPGVGPISLKEIHEKYSSPLEALQKADEWMDKKQKRLLEKW